MQIDQRFWRHVEIGGADDCWPWRGASTRQGYGTVRAGRSSTSAHRMAWLLTQGPIPDGLCVLHSCDNPPCCNPAHLWLGTASQHAQDSIRKGRRPARNAWAPRVRRLTDDDVRSIRAMREQGLSFDEIASSFRIATTTARNIVQRKRKAHVV